LMYHKVQRRAIKDSINMNPTSITIQRVKYEEHEGGRKRVETEVGPFRVLMYGRGPGSRKIEDEAGVRRETDWHMLTDHNADVRWGSNVEDTFEVPEIGKFKIIDGQEIRSQGKLAGYWIELERVE